MSRPAVEANAEVVWGLVADANTYAQWGPWEDGGYRPSSPGPSREGVVQWFRYKRRATSVERVLEVEPPRRLVYTVIEGLPIKNYRAEITLEPRVPSGTSIRWSASWDPTLMGRLVRRRLQKVYVEVMEALVAEADRRRATSTA